MQFIDEAIRVMQLTRKPRKDEFLMVSKVTGLGIIVIGLLGVAIILVARLLGIE